MDMVGRLQDKLVLQGVGSSAAWQKIIEQANVPLGLPLTLQDDSYLPTDASVFFLHGVPILSAFTGNHSEYHTPRDTPEKLNYEGIAKVANLMSLVCRYLIALNILRSMWLRNDRKTVSDEPRCERIWGPCRIMHNRT